MSEIEANDVFLHLTMPDNSVWQVEADLIATSRATALADIDWGTEKTEDWQKTFNYEYSRTMHNPYVLCFWASRMRWAELNAIMIESPPRNKNYEEWYSNKSCFFVVHTEDQYKSVGVSYSQVEFSLSRPQ